MEPMHNTGKAGPSTSTSGQAHDTAAPVPVRTAAEHPFGPHAPAILATEHWSLLGTRSLIWKAYFTTGHHDDESGLMATYMLDHPRRLEWWVYFLVNTPPIVTTVVATLAAAIVVLVLQIFGASGGAVVAGSVAAFAQ
jgi:hypothetical protein